MLPVKVPQYELMTADHVWAHISRTSLGASHFLQCFIQTNIIRRCFVRIYFGSRSKKRWKNKSFFVILDCCNGFKRLLSVIVLFSPCVSTIFHSKEFQRSMPGAVSTSDVPGVEGSGPSFQFRRLRMDEAWKNLAHMPLKYSDLWCMVRTWPNLFGL